MTNEQRLFALYARAHARIARRAKNFPTKNTRTKNAPRPPRDFSRFVAAVDAG